MLLHTTPLPYYTMCLSLQKNIMHDHFHSSTFSFLVTTNTRNSALSIPTIPYVMYVKKQKTVSKQIRRFYKRKQICHSNEHCKVWMICEEKENIKQYIKCYVKISMNHLSRYESRIHLRADVRQCVNTKNVASVLCVICLIGGSLTYGWTHMSYATVQKLVCFLNIGRTKKALIKILKLL